MAPRPTPEHLAPATDGTDWRRRIFMVVAALVFTFATGTTATINGEYSFEHQPKPVTDTPIDLGIPS